MWRVEEADLEALALGAGVLGAGGGGNPYYLFLTVRELLRAGRALQVMAVEELPADACVVDCFGMGAPTVSYEKPCQGEELLRALRALEHHLGRRATAVIGGEIGGGNAFSPLLLGAQAGLPVVDGDGMGRALPELQMLSFLIYGRPPAPAVLADDKGNVVLLTALRDVSWLEPLARDVTVRMGGTAGVVSCPMGREEVRATCLPGSISRARALGLAMLEARRTGTSAVEAARQAAGGVCLFIGKVVDVERRTRAGFALGRMVLEGLEQDTGLRMEIEFQNENLVARRDGVIACTVPDLICVLDSEDGEPLSTEVLRYGLRASVLGLPAPSQLTTPRALQVVGPRAFGYALDYQPLLAGFGAAQRKPPIRPLW